MPPKGAKKAKTKAKGADPGGTGDSCGDVKVELVTGEKDAQNLDFHTEVQAAWNEVTAKFTDIESEGPLSIAEGGSQTPFSQKDLKAALKATGDTYVCGINFAWVNALFSATPGVPVRMSAVKQVRDNVFREPCALEHFHVGVPSNDYAVAAHKGGLMRVSPEEIAAAFILAVARDIKKHEPEDLLQKWYRQLRSTTCVFVLLPSQMDRYWYALERRENVEHEFQAVHRSCLQRLYEVSRFIEKLRGTGGSVNLPAVLNAYKTNLKNAITVCERMLNVPQIEAVLREMDGMPQDVFNPFDSHSRLQALVNKCRTQDDLLYVAQALKVQAVRQELTALTVLEIKGNVKDGGKGVVDLMFYKRDVKQAALTKAEDMFSHSPATVAWIRGTVAHKIADHSTWERADSDKADLAWRAGRSPAEIQWLNLILDLAFRKTYDMPLKIALRAGQTAAEAILREGIAHAWDNLQEKVDSEKPPEEPKDESEEGEPKQNPMENNDPLYKVKFVVDAPGEGKGATAKETTLAELPDDSKEQVKIMIDNARAQMKAALQFIPLETSDGALSPEQLFDAVRKSLSGKMKLDETGGKYVAIFYDPKLSGEATHRPAIRQPPLRKEVFAKLLKTVLGRSPDGDPPEQDVYFLFDGGKDGIHSDLLRPFSSMDVLAWTYSIYRDEDSVSRRFAKVQGTGVLQLDEKMLVVSKSALRVPRKKYENYAGSTAANTIGRVVMDDLSDLWQLPWPEQKNAHGDTNLVPVGGPQPGQDELEVKLAPRTRDSVEAVFYHSLPESIYLEVTKAFPIGAPSH